MKRIIPAFTIASLLVSSGAHAAEDMGLRFQNNRQAGVERAGLGMQASVTIKLGDRRVVRDHEKFTLGLVAGQFIARPLQSGGAVHHDVAGLASFKLRPGYSAKLDIAGQQVTSSYTKLGAAEEVEKEKKKRKQSTGDKVAWVAAVAGGVMVVLMGAFAIALASQGPTD